MHLTHRRPRKGSASRRSRGQGLAEFAIVFPVMMAVLGAIIQFGVIFWSQNTLTQIVRDTGRWEASQQANPCSSQATADAVAQRAGSIAQKASLIGYPGSQPWTTGTLYTTWPPVPDNRPTEGVEVAWPNPDPINLFATDCPPNSNQTACQDPTRDCAWFVTIRISHVIPVFIPGLQFLPGIGNQSCTCLSIAATTTFRMEPAPP